MARRTKEYVSNRSRYYTGGIAGRAGSLSGRITAERTSRLMTGRGTYGDARDNQLRQRELRVIRFAQRNTSLGMVVG